MPFSVIFHKISRVLQGSWFFAINYTVDNMSENSKLLFFPIFFELYACKDIAFGLLFTSFRCVAIECPLSILQFYKKAFQVKSMIFFWQIWNTLSPVNHICVPRSRFLLGAPCPTMTAMGAEHATLISVVSKGLPHKMYTKLKYYQW